MKFNELKNAIYIMETEELIKFIKENFTYSNNKKIYDYKNNIYILEKLDDKDRKYAIARMKQIEENKDFYKSISGIITLVLAIISGYISLYGNDIKLIGFILLILFFAFICIQMGDAKRDKAAVMLFRSLLEDSKKKEK